MQKYKHNQILDKVKHALSKEELTIIEHSLSQKRERVFKRYPMLFTLMGTFGLVATLYGFEKILDQTFLVEKPFFLLTIGIVILLFTGLLYKKL
ncbi:hypothetical protein KKA15_01745 [Patescibacteria group bacterium]|nr:hypothetical protein [Patescibacteria group bacterium]